MKPLRTIFLLFAVSLCAPRGLAQTGAAPTGPPPPAAEYNPKNWKEFTSEEGRFSALFPGTPVRQVGKAEQGEMYMYLLRTFAEYAVMYIEFPQPTIDTAHIKAMLDGGRDSGLASVEGRLLEEKDISLDGYTGRYHKVLAGTGHTIRSRTYVVGNRMYVVFIVMRDEGAPPAILKFHDETAAKFLDSFKLIPHGPPAGAAGGRSPVGEPKGQPAAEAQTEGEVNRLLRQMSERGEDAGLILGSRDESATPSPSESKPEGGLTGKILEQPAAEYPPIAKAARAQGAVVVLILVGEDGGVMAAQAERGHPLLQAAAVRAVRGWVFSPTTLGGKPVKVLGTVTVNFSLR